MLEASALTLPSTRLTLPAEQPFVSTAFGLLKGTAPTTAPQAVTFVSDRDFSLRKTSHIINAIPPPAAAELA